MMDTRVKPILEDIWDHYNDRAQKFPGEPDEEVFLDWFWDDYESWENGSSGWFADLFDIFTQISPGQSEEWLRAEFQDWLECEVLPKNPPPKISDHESRDEE